MGIALELLVFTGVFALAIGLLGGFINSSDNENRKLRALHEGKHYDPQPWSVHRGDSRVRR